MTARDLARKLEQAGRVAVRQTGSHRQFKHPNRAGAITIPMHGGDLHKGLVVAVLKQAGLR
jgi:predicted RNA binding protein YcfA (HicA-like mRNA interferase family)